mgnify:CR=1 FL=1
MNSLSLNKFYWDKKNDSQHKDNLPSLLLKSCLARLDEAFNPRDLEKGTAQFRRVRRQNIFLVPILFLSMFSHLSNYLAGVYELYHILILEITLAGAFVLFFLTKRNCNNALFKYVAFCITIDPCYCLFNDKVLFYSLFSIVIGGIVNCFLPTKGIAILINLVQLLFFNVYVKNRILDVFMTASR